MAGRRRAYGEGTISKRKDGRWLGIAELGWQDGKRRRKYVYGATRAEVAAKLAKVRSDQQTGQLIEDERITVQQFLDTWLQTIRPSVADSTWTRYEGLLRLHAVPSIGKLRLARLGPFHLEQLYTGRIRAGLSPTTVLQLHRVLHHALRDAVRWSLMPRNVCELVTPPRRASYEFRVLSSEQARTFLEAVRGDRLEALYVLAITTGMREGELFGLRWTDVNLHAGSVRLVRKLKTKSSRRQVLLPRVAVEALATHRERQNQEREFAGTAWEDNGLVFPNAVGRPLNVSNFLPRDFYPLLERTGLPRMRFHDLRHSAATLLLELGIHPKVVSEMLGHSQIGITLDLYSHVTATMQQQAVAALDSLFGDQLGLQHGGQHGGQVDIEGPETAGQGP
jgi:integrase